jgi:hypothetical protein
MGTAAVWMVRGEWGGTDVIANEAASDPVVVVLSCRSRAGRSALWVETQEQSIFPFHGRDRDGAEESHTARHTGRERWILFPR